MRCIFGFLTCLASAFIPSSDAIACFSPQFERTIIFERPDLVDDRNAPIVIEVTIEALTGMPNNRVVASARVDAILKGNVASDSIQISVPVTSCDRGVGRGVRGVVAGSIAENPQGQLELIPISETFVELERRRRAQSLSRHGH